MLSADPPFPPTPHAEGMVVHAARAALWVEPRPSNPPLPVWRDWALLAVVASWALLETVLREDVGWRPIALSVQRGGKLLLLLG